MILVLELLGVLFLLLVMVCLSFILLVLYKQLIKG